MKAATIGALTLALAASLLGCAGGGTTTDRGEKSTPATRSAEPTGVPDGWGPQSAWTLVSRSGVDTSTFVEGVDNPYWPLKPGTRWNYQAKTDEGTEAIDVAVTFNTRRVMGVACTEVRDTVRLDGELIEDTRDWYAQDKDGNVWYMGEAVDNYEDGKLADHEGSWEAGVGGAQAGIKVWAKPHVDQPPYYQEFYKGQAEDLGKDLRTDASATVPFGTYSDLLVVEEWTPLDPDVVERKYYAKGVGTVKEEMVRGGDEVVELTRFVAP